MCRPERTRASRCPLWSEPQRSSDIATRPHATGTCNPSTATLQRTPFKLSITEQLVVSWTKVSHHAWHCSETHKADSCGAPPTRSHNWKTSPSTSSNSTCQYVLAEPKNSRPPNKIPLPPETLLRSHLAKHTHVVTRRIENFVCQTHQAKTKTTLKIPHKPQEDSLHPTTNCQSSTPASNHNDHHLQQTKHQKFTFLQLYPGFSLEKNSQEPCHHNSDQWTPGLGSDSVEVLCQDVATIHTVQKFLTESNSEFYTHPTSDERTIKEVIRGLLSNITAAEVFDELLAMSYEIVNGRQFGNATRKMTLYMISLSKTSSKT